jgi:aspartyl-tRNA(Asn)/glutamyl-tRNA(Gln) amidotransferase subunit A
MDDLSLDTASQLREAFAAGRLSPVETCNAALDAIEERNPEVNAFVLVDPDSARQAAAESARRWQAGSPLGPLDGVTVSIKDMLLTRGWPTLRGSTLISAEGPWTEDAPAVARLRESGAVLLGKTTTPEFAWKGLTDSPRYGATGNPWDPSRHAGGSSGGSAAAVGLGMGALSVGTDGGGSVRIPAAFTGTIAFKPTYGRIPIYPPSAFGTLSHAGPITRSVADAALMLDVLSGADHRDWSAMPAPTASFSDRLSDGIAGCTVAFSADLGYARNDPAVDEAVRTAAGVFESAGAWVVETDPGFDDPTQAFHMLWFAGAAKALEDHRDNLPAVDPGLQECVEQGQRLSALQYLDAVAVRMELGRRMGAFHDEYDLLLTPTMPVTAFSTDQQAPAGWPSQLWTSWTPYTFPFNMTQQPAISVPCGFAHGMPVGLQIVGPRHADELVLRAAKAYEDHAGRLGTPPMIARNSSDQSYPATEHES